MSSSVGIGLAGILLDYISDHNKVFAVEEISTDAPEAKTKKPDMSSKNINAFCDTLARSDWDFIQVENDIEKAYDNFYKKLLQQLKFHFL